MLVKNLIHNIFDQVPNSREGLFAKAFAFAALLRTRGVPLSMRVIIFAFRRFDALLLGALISLRKAFHSPQRGATAAACQFMLAVALQNKR